jgi:hypothetical protein
MALFVSAGLVKTRAFFLIVRFGIDSTRTNFVFHDGRLIMNFEMRDYSSLLSDFPVQASMSQRWKLLEKEKSVA